MCESHENVTWLHEHSTVSYRKLKRRLERVFQMRREAIKEVWSQHLELYVRRCFFSLCNLKEVAFRKAEHIADQIRRKHLELGVEIADNAVIEASRGLEMVFEFGELPLKFEEVLVRFEIWIRLREREEALQSLTQHVFRGRMVSDGLRAHRHVARLDDFLECAGFMRRISFDRFNEIRDEISASFELDVNVRPGFVRFVFQAHEAVVRRDKPECDCSKRCKKDPQKSHNTFCYMSEWMLRLQYIENTHFRPEL